MLVPVDADTVDALSKGDAGGRAIAPGWPHDDTAAALSFVRTGGTQFLVLDDDGRVAGECGTKTPPRPDGSVEIGYGLAAPSRGRGLGSRAVAELVSWLDGLPEVKVIRAEVHVSNTASRQIVERLGFVPEGPPAQGYLQYRRPADGDAS
jgi:ribosomal-protein-alanine N-acetyltransferase